MKQPTTVRRSTVRGSTLQSSFNLELRTPNIEPRTRASVSCRRVRLFAVLCLSACQLVILSACAQRHAQAPPWIGGVASGYPAEQYLVGVGQGDSAPVAAERAYAAVARIFKADISAQSRDWESYLLLEAKGSQTSERRVTLDNLTRVSTDKVLENVKLLETWYDPAAHQHYAMAGMHRGQAEQALLERIGQLDEAVSVQLKEAHDAAEPLTRIRQLRRAIKNLALREAYNADLRVIRASGRGSDAGYQLAALASELQQFMAANLLVTVDVVGEQAEPVRRAIIDGLVREGLPITAGEGGRTPDLLATGTVHVWDVDVPDKQFRYVRWCSDFLVTEPAKDRVVGAVSKSGREGHLTPAEARAKAGRVLQQQVSSELAKALAGYVYGDVEPPTIIPPAACPTTQR
jgi:hypothetical protein